MKSERVVIDRRRSLESEDEIAARKAKKQEFLRVIEYVLPKRKPWKHKTKLCV